MEPRAVLLRHAWSIAVVLGLGAGAVAQEEPSPPVERTAAEATQDGETERRLRAVLAEVAVFERIVVTVRSGVAELTGTAPSSAVREAAAEVARGMEGVVYVENLIELPEPAEGPQTEAESRSANDQAIAERLRGIYARFDDLVGVRVDVVAGVAELSGSVVSPSDRDQAEEIAKSIDGVVFVSNRIEETVDIWARIVPSIDKLAEWLRDVVVALPILLLALFVAWLLWRIGNRVARAQGFYARITEKKLVQEILAQVVRTLFVLLGIFVALEILDATALVGAVLGTAGIVGLALGFAFRDIAENYLASIILSFRQPFRSKDFVDIDGSVGTVIRMTIRETVLLTPEGNHLTLPNAAVFKARIVNFTRAPTRRFDVGVGVGTEVDLERASALGVGVLRDMAGVIDDPAPFAAVETLGDWSVTIRFYGWVDQRSADWVKVQSAAVRLIKAVMDENGIHMPVPMQQIALTRAEREPARRVADESVREQAATADVRPERHIEKQVEAELRESDEADLLEDEAPVADGGR